MIFRNLLSFYGPRYAPTIVYMLQSTEYEVGPYLKWFWRTQNFSQVVQRRTLDPTRSARLLVIALRLGALVQLLSGGLLIFFSWKYTIPGLVLYGVAVILAYPLVWAHLATIPLLLGRWLIIRPRERQLIAASEQIFAAHRGKKIAVAGSYGKTTMKELLLTVLSEGLKVAATPANKNVSSSHAVFAQTLAGDEDVVIIEYGEGAPGDVARFAAITHPTHGIITGLAPAHLGHYKTLEAAGRDIFSLAEYLKGQNVYVNTEAASIKPFLRDDYHTYDAHGVLGWSISHIELTTTGVSFRLQKGNQKLVLNSGLLGRHQVGVLALVAVLGLEFGMTGKQVQTGAARTVPFEHRMQPYNLGGAWIIDDTYNGNLEGIRAGTELLKALPAKRKIYVTPGLVDQGVETTAVHLRVGELIAAAQPDIVILMQNSVTGYIEQGLKAGDYRGKVQVESQPLAFYTSLDQFVAAGDVVLMQNDWTDNYA